MMRIMDLWEGGGFGVCARLGTFGSAFRWSHCDPHWAAATPSPAISTAVRSPGSKHPHRLPCHYRVASYPRPFRTRGRRKGGGGGRNRSKSVAAKTVASGFRSENRVRGAKTRSARARPRQAQSRSHLPKFKFPLRQPNEISDNIETLCLPREILTSRLPLNELRMCRVRANGSVRLHRSGAQSE